MRTIGTLRKAVREAWPTPETEAKEALRKTGIHYNNTKVSRKWGLLKEVRKRLAEGLTVSPEWATEKGWQPTSLASAISKIRKNGEEVSKDYLTGEYYIHRKEAAPGPDVNHGSAARSIKEKIDKHREEYEELGPSALDNLGFEEDCSSCAAMDQEIAILYKVIDKLTK